MYCSIYKRSIKTKVFYAEIIFFNCVKNIPGPGIKPRNIKLEDKCFLIKLTRSTTGQHIATHRTC